MKLLREEILDSSVLVEETQEGKKYYIEGIFMQAERKNGNGRIYPSRVLSEAVETYKENYVLKNRALGELGHPDSPQLILKNASHKIISLRQEGDNYYGKALVLDTPNGQIIKNFVDADIQLAMSSRGLGDIAESRGAKVVKPGFTLVTAGDVVHNPSAPDAFMEAVMEDIDWVYTPTGWVSGVSEAKKEISESYKSSMTKEEKQKLYLEAMNTLLSKFSRK